ncbi:MAG: O-methyltransferase [Terracidiphilus sp.]
MSSGATIPYHLRQNKAIDRNLFIDLLTRISRYRNISDYQYVGFGGPFLEDFKILHGALRLRDMTSLERNDEVVKRQNFNKPLSCITILKKTSGEYLTEFDFDKPSIVWFDFTSAKDLGLQLAEIELLARKLNAGDVVKCTFNASPEPLGKPKDDSDLREFRLAEFRNRASVYAPSNVDVDSVTSGNYPNSLLRCIESALKRGLDTKPRSVIMPLSSFTYADGQQMLTVTAIILDEIDQGKFLAETRLEHWPFRCNGWDNIRSISVPQLSAKERLHLESMLPGETEAANIIGALGYYVGDSASEGEKLMANFIDYYRLYPQYSRVVL